MASATSATFTILPAPLTITADDKTSIYGAPLPQFTATHTGAVFGQTLAALSGTLTLTSPATSLSPASGSPYTITPSGLSSPNYAITYLTGKLTVKPADVTVVSSNAAVSYGAASVTMQVTVSPNVPSTAPINEGAVSFAVSDSHGTTITGITSQTVASGKVSVSLPLPGSAYAGVCSIAVVYNDPGQAPNLNNASAQPVTLTISNPIPAISSLSPMSAQVGVSGTVTITGTGFVPDSVVRWNGADMPATFVSPTQLAVSIASQSQAGAADIAVFNAGPGGRTSNGATFLFTANGATATVASATSASPTGSASVTVGGSAPFGPGSITGQAVGAGTFTLAQFNAMPVAAPIFGPEGGWFDIHVSAGNSFSLVTVTDCNMGSGHFAYWWTGSVWQLMSNQVYDPVTGCNTVTFSDSTSPSIGQLNGTSAEVWGWSQGIGLPVCIGDEFVGTYGRLPQSLPELVNWGNAVGLRNPSNGNWSCSPTLAAPQSPPPTDGAFQRSNDGRVIPDWDSFDSEIRSVGYPGPYDHGSQEIAAYERACLCTLVPYTPPPPIVCSSGYYMTINGAKTVDQMRSELHGAGYPNWQWAGPDEIISVYGRTSGQTVSLCSTSSPQPGPSTPTPSSLYYARDASDNPVSQSQAESGSGGPLYYFINDNGTSVRAVVDANGTIAGVLVFAPAAGLQGQTSDWVIVANYTDSTTGVQLGVGEAFSSAKLGNYSPPSRTFAVTGGVCLNVSVFGTGLFGTASLCPTIASDGSVGLLLSYGGGGSSAVIGGGLGVGGQFSNGGSIKDLTGVFAVGGVSGRLGAGATLDGFTGNGNSVVGGDFTVGVGGQISLPFVPGFEVHVGGTNTVIVGPVVVLPTALKSFVFQS